MFRQPETDEERELCEESVEGCPCASIGNNGADKDWAEPPTIREKPPIDLQCGHCGSSKPLWDRLLSLFSR